MNAFRPLPSREEFKSSSHGPGIPPLSLEIPYTTADVLYPAVSGPGSFVFESVRGPFRIARYSFIGFDPLWEYRLKNSIVQKYSGPDALREFAQGRKPFSLIHRTLESYSQLPSKELPPFQGGLAGIFCYDFVHYIERLSRTTEDDLNLPDLHLLLIDRLIAFDHEQKRAWIVVAPGLRGGATEQTDRGALHDEAFEVIQRIYDRITPPPVQGPPVLPEGLRIEHDVTQEHYEWMVSRAKQYIAAGDIFQANLSLRVSADVSGVEPWQLYRRLREINPSPFAGFLDFGDYQIASSSPERLVMVRDRIAELRPIAGTRPRGRDTSEDAAMRAELLLNEKERAEHIMLIDLERNDIGRVCEYGTVEVDELMTTEDYSHVMHIVSNVRGKLAEKQKLHNVIRATFPGGTITGVPKVRCMQIIDELEQFNRGPYTGSFGYLGFSGSMDLNIIIRTFTVRNNRAYVQAGAGIVADSDPLREYRESMKKAQALIQTLNAESS